MKYALALTPLATVLVFGCVDKDTNEDELGNGTETGDGDGDGQEVGVDGEGGDGDGDGDTGGDGDCAIGEYVPLPFGPVVDWSNASGSIDHAVHYSVYGPPMQGVEARFFTSDFSDDSLLCVETIVESVGVDSCRVWYTLGEGVGGETPSYWYEDLLANSVTFDLGSGPIALEPWGPTEFNPTSYGADLPAPPNGVPFGGIATLAATFESLPALDLDLDVPNDILPLGYAIDTATLSSEELTTWTWATPGGSAPLELAISLGATPAGSGWSEWVEIECEVTDDGEFEFPLQYLDLARERLGSELHAGVTLSRAKAGTVPLAGKDLHWRSSVEARLAIAVVD